MFCIYINWFYVLWPDALRIVRKSQVIKSLTWCCILLFCILIKTEEKKMQDFYFIDLPICQSSRHMGKPTNCLDENKGADQLTAKLISAFVFATRIVQFLFYLNPKFPASTSFQCLYRSVCVGPVRKPHCWFSHEAAQSLLVQHHGSSEAKAQSHRWHYGIEPLSIYRLFSTP